MADTTLPGLLATGDHASRPAANAVGSGALYSCTDHSLVYQSDGTSWTTWATLGGAGVTEILDLPTAETDDTLVLAPDGAGGVEFRAETGGGGGSSWPPGSPDATPSSPHASDDEFTTTDTTEPIAGWTTLGAADLDHICVNSHVASHLHIRDDADTGGSIVGIYKAIPSTPFTFTVKMTDLNIRNQYNHAGVAVMEASPGKLETWALQYNGTEGLFLQPWTNRTTSGSVFATYGHGAFLPFVPMYFHLKVNSATSVDYGVSRGLAITWLQTARNPGFTVGAVGIVVDSINATKLDAYFDFARFS